MKNFSEIQQITYEVDKLIQKQNQLKEDTVDDIIINTTKTIIDNNLNTEEYLKIMLKNFYNDIKMVHNIK
jgi:hypothetical protein